MDNKKMMWVWVLIVLIVVAGLVYITINNKSKDFSQLDEEQNQVVQEEQNKNMDNTQNIDGLKITILKEGTGDVAKVGDSITVNYTGTFTDGKMFDSNVDPKAGHVEPFIFSLGVGQVIKGWDLGVVGMKVGEKRKLEIRSDLAYGERGAGGAIPPNTDLIFEVELLGINK